MNNSESRNQNSELPDAIAWYSCGETKFYVVDKGVYNLMEQDARKMGDLLLQMGSMISTMQKRMDEMEARQKQVTASHEEVKRIQRVIRWRAGEICDKYQLTDPESGKILRAAIKKDILNRWGVKDLHDLPERALDAVRAAVGSWVNIRLVMERRTQG